MSITSIPSVPVASVASDGARGYAPEASAPANVPAQRPASPEVSAATPPPSEERVAQAVKQVNEAFTQKGQNLYAAIERDKATGINVVKVLDKNTREVISQFPSKAIVAMAEALQSQGSKGQLIHVSA
jgi:flagellar protein FlaG